METEKIKLKCPRCGKEFEAEMPTLIDITGNDVLREQIINMDFDGVRCPDCNENVQTFYPFDVIDTEKNYEVKCLPQYAFIMKWFEDKKEPRKDDEVKTTTVGVLNIRDRNNKVLALHYGLDYRVAELYLVTMRFVYAKRLLNTYEGYEITRSNVAFDEYNGALVVLFDWVLENKQTGETKADLYALDIEWNVYNELKEKNKALLNGKDCFDAYFDYDVAMKFCKKGRKERKNLKVAEILLPYEKEITYALIKDYNNDKFSVEDAVVIRNEKGTQLGHIISIIDTTDFEFPLREDEMSVVMWHYKPVELVASGSSNDELDDTDLTETFKNDCKGQKSVALGNADVYLLVTASIDTNDLIKALENDCVENDMMHIEFKKHVTSDGKNFLCVYTNYEKLDSSVEYSNFIYKFNDLARLVLMEPYRYQGIVINDGTDNFAMNQRRLLDYLFEKTMCNADSMRELYGKLTDKEKAYIGEYYYDLVTEPYLGKEKWDPVKTALRWGKTKEDIHKDIDIGYEKLMDIVTDNYA